MSLPDVCILAGGLGTRLGAEALPKAMVPVAGEPFVVHQLRLLAAQGARRVVLCVGHLGDVVERGIGRSWGGIHVDYSYDSPDLDGTLGALRRAAGRLGPRFLVLYGDTYLRLDYGDFYRRWTDSGRPAGMTVLRNEGRWDRSNVILEGDSVRLYDKHDPVPAMLWIDYGLGALTHDALGLVGEGERDLAALYQHLSRSGGLFGYQVDERFYEIGTPAARFETEEFLGGLRSLPPPR